MFKPTLFTLMAFAPISQLHAGVIRVADLGNNVIVNGDGETNASDSRYSNDAATGWTTTSGSKVTAAKYSDMHVRDGAITPSNMGSGVLSGGGYKDGHATGTQTFDLSKLATFIDAGDVSFGLSGLFGFTEGQSDVAILTLTFRNADGKDVATETLGNLDGSNTSKAGLHARSTSGTLASGVRTAIVTLEFQLNSGGWNDAYADNLSLEFSAPSAAPSPATLPFFALGFAAFGRRRPPLPQ